MRKYPKKCPKCGEDMEPVFTETMGRFGLGDAQKRIDDVKPIFWKCIYCGFITKKNITSKKSKQKRKEK